VAPPEAELKRIARNINALRRQRQELWRLTQPDILVSAAEFGVTELDVTLPQLTQEFKVEDARELVRDIFDSLPANVRASASLDVIESRIARLMFIRGPTELPLTEAEIAGIPLAWERDFSRWLNRRHDQIVRFPNDPTRREQLTILTNELRQRNLIPEGDLSVAAASGLESGLMDFMDEAADLTGNLSRATIHIIGQERDKIATGDSKLIRIPPGLAAQQVRLERETLGQEAREKALIGASPETVRNELSQLVDLSKFAPDVVTDYIRRIRDDIARDIQEFGVGRTRNLWADPALLASKISSTITTNAQTNLEQLQFNFQQGKLQDQTETEREAALKTAHGKVLNEGQAITAVKAEFATLNLEDAYINSIAQLLLEEYNSARGNDVLPVPVSKFLERYREDAKLSSQIRAAKKALEEQAGAEAKQLDALRTDDEANRLFEQFAREAGLDPDTEITPEDKQRILNKIQTFAGQPGATPGGIQAGLQKIFFEPDSFRQRRQAQDASATLGQFNIESAIRRQAIQGGILAPGLSPRFAAAFEQNVVPRLASFVRAQALRQPDRFQTPADVQAFITPFLTEQGAATLGIPPFFVSPHGFARQMGIGPGVPIPISVPKPPIPTEEVSPFLREAAGESVPFLNFLQGEIPALQDQFAGTQRQPADFGLAGQRFESFRGQLRDVDAEIRALREEWELDESEAGGEPWRIAEREQLMAPLLARQTSLLRMSQTPAGVGEILRGATPAAPEFGQFFGEQLPGLRERFQLSPAGLQEEQRQEQTAEREQENTRIRAENERIRAERDRRRTLRGGSTTLVR
jgi:hypothetical protein